MTKRENEWLRVEMAKGDPTTADLFLFGFIGDWVDDLFEDIGFGFDSVKTAKKFRDELDALPDSVKNIRLRVNSPGGDVFGAVAIANMLRDQRSKGRNVSSSIEGLAASAASIVVQAGDPIRIADNSLVMIHDPFTEMGNSDELRAIADELDKVTEKSIIATYQWHSSLSTKEIAALMDAETWMDADEAIENGFATEKVEGLKLAAALDPRTLSILDVPEKYRARMEELTMKDSKKDSGRSARFFSRLAAIMKTDDADPKPHDAPKPSAASHEHVIRACGDAGLAIAVAQELIAAGATEEQVKARVEAEKTKKADAEVRTKEIHALCLAAELPELAAGYISGSMSPSDVRTHLTTLTAKLDAVEIDGHLNPDGGVADSAESWKRAFANANRGFFGRKEKR